MSIRRSVCALCFGVSLVATGACTKRVPEYEFVATELGGGGDSTLYRVRVIVDSSQSRVRYMMFAPRTEIQVFGIGGTFNPEIVTSECRVFNAENFACANFNFLFGQTVGRLAMTDGVLSESGVDGQERVYARREVPRGTSPD